MVFNEQRDDARITRSQLRRYGCGQVIQENAGAATFETHPEPFMGVRVRCQTDRIEAVKSDLMRRCGLIVSSEVVRGLAFVRAVAPLRNLIGYAGVLTHLAGSDARQVMWLSHYAPVATPHVHSAASRA